jgi:transposase
MNIQLSQALSDVSGATGQAMIRAIVAGERDPHKLAGMRNYRCKKDEQEIAKALTGTWREEHLFILKQSLELYDFYTRQLEACDTEIEHTYSLVRPDWVQPNLPDIPKSEIPTARMHPRQSRSASTSNAFVAWTSPQSMG